MAVVKFDPVTYKGFLKVIPDNSAPTVFFVVKKANYGIKAASSTSLLIYSDGNTGGTAIATTGNDALDKDDNVLATAAAQLTYITQNDY